LGFFKKDPYPDRNTEQFWTSGSYPFWFTDLISAMDSLTKLDFKIDNPNVKKASEYFIKNQYNSGTFKFKLLRGKDKDLNLWITLAVCRILKRLF